MTLQGSKVALLIEDEYQILEGWYPLLRLQEAGADVRVIGSGTKNSYDSKEHYPMEVDAAAADVSASDFDAVVVPGGFAPDNMRLHPEMISLVRDMNEAGKLVTAICHGGWVLVSAGVLKGKNATGYLPIKDDVENAGGTWVDEAVVVDGNVITSRTPVDLPDFTRAIIAYLEGRSSETEHATRNRATDLAGDPAGARAETGASIS
ncbi:protease I [Arthrobacter oryzae]|uniref:type 1 glutamine amidotransferase domain-containing protein n=1 Tax=Arthrobacter oryzae TaxID=409290 RepID=UPI00277DFD29|nr:type 1 glutamine amidotransferase domain-containing protein [Arthrobacter oryzae]MDP9987411.1 protease I [Arthrobacter oryzae]